GVIAMLSQFAATQHCSINHLIEVDGDAATCSCYTYATHYLEDGLSDPWNIVGARYDFTARRLPQGWRIVSLKWTRLFDQGNAGVWPEVARRLAAQSDS
ncbi:MAG TPA: nuclear transport factor 2 family protein, partial [Stellaceae bacterium]|nr:nuclear transport factor 2 family protein [Stellaceae bacterium]